MAKNGGEDAGGKVVSKKKADVAYHSTGSRAGGPGR